MNDRATDRRERRRDVRIAPKGTLRFHTREHEQHGRIANLSAGGAYIQTSVSTPEPLLLRTVDIELRLDSGIAEWLRASGRILRIDRDGVAIAFDRLAAPLLHMIDQQSSASRARERIVAVVLIDPDPQRSSAMAAGFRAFGWSIITAATPLEAIVRLGESSFEPDVIAVADTHTGDADDMRKFVEREHPNAMLITIDDEIFRPDGFASWFSSAQSDADLPAGVREAVLPPLRRP